MAVNVKKKDGLFVGLGAALFISTALFCLAIAVASHLTNFFFLPANHRYLLLSLVLLFSVYVFVFLFLTLKHKANPFDRIEKGNPVILAFAALLVTGIIFAAGVIPPARIPISHTLEIQALPAEGRADSTISVLKINRAIRAPRAGGAEVNLDEVSIQGSYERNSDGIRLDGGATLTYSAFYSGCITVHLGTSPKAGQVRVRFDAVEEKYSLASSTESSTIVDLCSPMPFWDMPLKWQVILLLVYFADLVSVVTLSGIAVMGLYYLGFNQNVHFQKTLRKILVVLSLMAVMASTIYQVRRILFYPDETTTNAPPARPSSVSGPLKFTTIYQESLHTKRFGHSFILIFMDIYPKLDAVYIDEGTWNSFSFRSTQFEEWFAVYHLQPAGLMPVNITRAVINQMIDENNWSYHEIILDDQGKTIRLHYLPTSNENYVLVTNQGYGFYLLPGSLLDAFAGGQS